MVLSGSRGEEVMDITIQIESSDVKDEASVKVDLRKKSRMLGTGRLESQLRRDMDLSAPRRCNASSSIAPFHPSRQR